MQLVKGVLVVATCSCGLKLFYKLMQTAATQMIT